MTEQESVVKVTIPNVTCPMCRSDLNISEVPNSSDGDIVRWCLECQHIWMDKPAPSRGKDKP